METVSFWHQLQWEDIDKNNHANNIFFFRMFQEARIQQFHLLTNSTPPSPFFSPLFPPHSRLQIEKERVNFLKQIHYPSSVLCRIWVEKIDDFSFQNYFEMESVVGEKRELVAKGVDNCFVVKEEGEKVERLLLSSIPGFVERLEKLKKKKESKL
eukprot:CAMPEP_0201526350 /NCGR_PEP_ID=MMETSP0161_2-20130828/31575_1 /ASSEMBLY_ACC=CAM_ASM_000251 /TAXON_ID=180227 /ORGANISM="Neoparamoeba aestuarina, Strain SoJaBio B1-5/56/2" /LENGTH=154 /DNA_ID=CAMNT_0047926709 /DNA_START=94 /DNA_END=558 /DNA_ORIENTATION=-